MSGSLTRRQALASSVGLALAGLAPGGDARAMTGAAEGGAVDVRVPIASSAFRRRRRGLAVTRAVRSPRPLEVLGLRWDEPEAPRLEIRTRRRGRWSRWVALRDAAEHAPDGARRRRITDAAALGGTRVFQLRAERIPGGLVALGVALPSRPPPLSRRATAAQVDVSATVIPRTAWRAQAPRSTPGLGTVTLAFVHHTVSTNDYGPEDSSAIVRAIQHYHRNTLGWNDIGYNLLVDRHGQVFEGRAGGIDQAVVGAQAQGYNSLSTGIAVIGTHTAEPVTPETFEALAAVLAWKLALHGVPTAGAVTVTSAGGPSNRYPAGRHVSLERISGHRDGDATACPGEALHAQLPALRARAGELAGGGSPFSLAVKPRRVNQLAPAAVSGRVVRADGSVVAGAAVEIQAKTARGWEPLTTAVTDPTGAYSTSVALPYTRSLRAVTTDPTAGVIVSGRAPLEVRSAVSARVKPDRLPYGRRTLVLGTVEPRRPRRRAIVTVERRGAGGRYRRVTRFNTEVRDGRLRVPLYPSLPGLYRVRVSVRGDRLNAPSRSAYLFARALR